MKELKVFEDILPSVKRGAWREGEDPHEDKAFLDAKGKAIARDGGACHFCGWQDEKWLEGHHLDDDHSNNSPSNIVTCCAWCHRSFHIGLAGVNEMMFIGISPIPNKPLPPQPLLNQSVRMYDWLQSAPKEPPKYKAWMASFQEYLEICIKHAENILGTSNPVELGNVLRSISDEDYAKRGSVISGFRLIPTLMQELDPSVEAQRIELERRNHWIQKIKSRLGAPDA